MQVKVKKLRPDAVIPKYAKDGDAGLDLTATEAEYKDGRLVYGTGLAFEIPYGYVGLIFPRSSISKQDLRLTNCVGVVDSGYRGEVKAVFENDAMQMRGESEFLTQFWDPTTANYINKGLPEHKVYGVGERIAQMIIVPYPQVELVEAESLSETARGAGGFGSTGK